MNHIYQHFPKIIGVDVSGSLISACICEYARDNYTVHCCKPRFTRATPKFDRDKYGGDFEKYLKVFIRSIHESILEVKANYINNNDSRKTVKWDELPIGISFSGQIGKDGDIYSASSIFGSERPKNLNLISEIKTEPELKSTKIFVLNNISAASWEYSVEKSAYKRFLVLHIGSGVGSKVFDNVKKEIIIDSLGLAGELGHISIPKPSHLKDYEFICNCGQENHLAAFILPDGLRCLYKYYSKGEESQEDIFSAINKNFDNFGKSIIRELVELVGRTISYMILAIGVDKVIIKGEQFYQFIIPVREYFVDNLNEIVYRYLKDYYPESENFIDSTLIFKDRDRKTGMDHEDADEEDRLDSIKGMLRYITHFFDSNYRVTKGYFASYPTFLLSYKYDIFYPVIRSENIFKFENTLLADLIGKRKTLIIVDENYIRKISNDFYSRVIEYFKHKQKKVCEEKYIEEEKDFESYDIIIEMITPISEGTIGGEKKDMDNVIKIIDWAQKYQLPRDGLLVAIGGGVVLDTVGFAAQQFRRSIDYIKVPTTLIGQIDAGIGVKVGVNFGNKKNLIGAFYPPKFVVNDITFLFTLGDKELMCGIAEILKMGIICSSEIIQHLEKINHLTGAHLRGDRALQETFIQVMDKAIETMLVELQNNLFEKELKRIVDFGHTFSPIIESISDYRIPHGLAVAIDMYICIIIAAEMELISTDIKNRYIDLLEKYNLLINPHLSGRSGKPNEEILVVHKENIFTDSIKKTIQHRGGNLNLVVPCAQIGQSGFINLTQCPSQDTRDYKKIVTVELLKSMYDNALDTLIENKKIIRIF